MWYYLKRKQPSHNRLSVYGSKLSMVSKQMMVEHVLPRPKVTSVRSNHSGRYLEQIQLRAFVSVQQKSRNGKMGCTMGLKTRMVQSLENQRHHSRHLSTLLPCRMESVCTRRIPQRYSLSFFQQERERSCKHTQKCEAQTELLECRSNDRTL